MQTSEKISGTLNDHRSRRVKAKFRQLFPTTTFMLHIPRLISEEAFIIANTITEGIPRYRGET